MSRPTPVRECRYGAACSVHRRRTVNEIGMTERDQIFTKIAAGIGFAAVGRDHGLDADQVRKLVRRGDR